ncbi:MAG: VWA domain-containing protein [Bacteroidia bacterium]|nr:VWA domain-containing protein [Bacteroidia bacterium]
MLSKIIVNSPWYFFVLSILFGLFTSYFLYFRNRKNKDAPLGVLRMMSILRFLYLCILCFLLLSILFKHIKTETEKPTIVLAIDNSSSMVGTGDSVKIRKEISQDLKSISQALGEKYELKTLLFGSRVTSGESLPAFTEKETDLENLINEVENNYSNQNVGAMVILSDGIFNKGASPVYSAEKLGFPVYTIASGDTNEIRDVLIAKVNHNQVAYLGNNFPVEVILQAKKFNQKTVLLSLYENGAKKSEQNITINSDNFTGVYHFTLSAGATGIVKYTARVTAPEGDKNVGNNSRDFLIEVIDNKEKILLLAANPHPDIAAIKDAVLNNTSYDISYGLMQDFKGNFKSYNLVILHGFSNNNLTLLKNCQDNAIPYWIIAPSTSDNLPGLRLSGTINKYNDAEPQLENSFGYFTLSSEFRSFANDLPAVKTFFGNYNLGNGSSVLLKQKIGTLDTDNPILYCTEVNGLKSAVFIGDGLWKWKFRDFTEHNNHNLFNELITKCVQFLSVKSDKSFFRVIFPKIVNENVRVELQAEVYNRSYQLINEPEVSLILKNADNKTFNYTFSKTSNAYALDFGLLPPGEYEFEAKVTSNNELFIKKGRFVVKEVASEKTNIVADHHLLFQLANRTNGKMFYLNNNQDLIKELMNNENIKPIVYSQSTVSSAIDLKWIFWVILLILATEWFFRKRYLTI